jgi:hypothetical protein
MNAAKIKIVNGMQIKHKTKKKHFGNGIRYCSR